MKLMQSFALAGALVLSAAPSFAESSSQEAEDGSLLHQPAEKTLNQPIQETIDQAEQDIQEARQPKPEDFLEKAAEMSASEIELAKLAQQKAQSNEVKDYARQMEQDHQAAVDELKQVASKLNAEEPQAQSSEKAAKAREKMADKTGAAFDKAYIEHQVKSHEKAIEEFEQQAERGATPELQQFAKDQLPKLREHQQQAKELEQRVRG